MLAANALCGVAADTAGLPFLCISRLLAGHVGVGVGGIHVGFNANAVTNTAKAQDCSACVFKRNNNACMVHALCVARS